MTLLLRRKLLERLFERAIYWINFNYYSLDTSINFDSAYLLRNDLYDHFNTWP